MVKGNGAPKLKPEDRLTLQERLRHPVFQSLDSIWQQADTGDFDFLQFNVGQIACLFGAGDSITRHPSTAPNTANMLKLLGWTAPPGLKRKPRPKVLLQREEEHQIQQLIQQQQQQVHQQHGTICCFSVHLLS
jgi:hypothetical protein